MTQITANGTAYSDDGTAANDMRNGGFRTKLLPMLGDVMTQTGANQTTTAASAAAASASAAAASASAAAAAASAATLAGTSTTSLLIEVASKVFTTQSGKQFGVGQWMIAVDTANSANYMAGQVTAYTGTTLTISVDTIGGSGTIASWNLYLSGKTGAQGATGATGASGASVPRLAVSTNTTIVAADVGKLIDCTNTITVTLSAPATLGANWSGWAINNGSGDVTLAHTSGNIDGLASFILWPGAARFLQCDGSTVRTIAVKAGKRTWTASGTYVHAPGLAAVLVRATGAGASGGAGGRAGAGVATNGGPGGGGGETLETMLTGIAAGTSITVTVPSAPTGTAGRTTDGACVVGTAGGDAVFTGYLTAIGGKATASVGGDVTTVATACPDPGGIGSNLIGVGTDWAFARVFSARSATQGSAGDQAGGAGGNGCDATSARNGFRSLRGGGGGGGGGSINTGNTATAGGTGGSTGQAAGAMSTKNGLGGAAGAAATDGSQGTARTDSPAGDGGGGGGAGTAAKGGNGAAGLAPGGGGGGGGASRTGFDSGTGGDGTRGEITIVEVI